MKIFQLIILFIGLTTTSTWSQVLSTYEVKYYDVPKKDSLYTVRELKEYQPEACKRVKHSSTNDFSEACSTTGVTYNTKFSMNDGFCSLNKLGVTSNTVITIPKFQTDNEFHQKKYDEYSQGLLMHELGHFEIYKKIIPEIDTAFKNIQKSKDCEVIKSEVNLITEKYLSPTGMLRSLNGDYDKNTKGGRSQYKSPF